jgi:integrase
MSNPVYKRGAVWWCRVRDRRGRIVRRTTKCRDYLAALAAHREFERIAADPHHAAASETTLESSVKAYYAELGHRGVSPATLRKEATKAGQLLRAWKLDMPMSGIDARLVADYITRREGEGVSAHTVKMELGTLGRVLKVARHFGRFDRPIEQVLPIQYGSKHKPRTRWLTQGELAALLRELRKDRAAHIAFFVSTGARLGEASRARRGDVLHDRSMVRLRGTKTALADAEVPITPITRQLLDLVLEHAPGPDLLFNPWGKLHRDLELACERAGIDKCTPNDLRRTFGHWYRQAGLEPSDVAPMLRHATDKLAQTTYANARGTELRTIVESKLRLLPVVPGLYQPGVARGPERPRRSRVIEDVSRGNTGAPGKSRTCGQRFRKALLCPLSYGGVCGLWPRGRYRCLASRAPRRNPRLVEGWKERRFPPAR